MFQQNGWMVLLLIILWGCHAKRPLVNHFVQEYQHCPDSILTYYSGEIWEGLLNVNNTSYTWGLDSQITKGPVTYYQKKHIGKGSILLLDDTYWVVSKLHYKNGSLPPFKHGMNPKPLPSTHQVRLILTQMCP